MQVFVNAEDNEQYSEIYSQEHYVEYRIVIGSGDSKIICDDNAIRELKTYHTVFDGEKPSVGNAIAGEIDVKLNGVVGDIPRAARLAPYVRLVSADGLSKTKWIMKGIFYIDTREFSKNEDGLSVLTIHGYDALAKAADDFPSSTVNGSGAVAPVTEVNIVNQIAAKLGVAVDSRTWDVMTHNYSYGIPIGYSMGEILSYIAASYAGNFVITEQGKLRLVSLAELPEETNLLIDHVGFVITFGEGNEMARILV